MGSIESDFMSKIKYGVKSIKVCASCSDISLRNNLNSNVFEEFCGPQSYGSDAVASGLLFLPIENSNEIVNGALKGSLFLHGTKQQSFDVPSETWGAFDFGGEQNIAFFVASFGVATLLPDYLGYGESYQYFKSFGIKNAYQTSSIPLYLHSQDLVSSMTDCETMLSDSLALGGYSEGGYVASAVADGLERLGMDIIYAYAMGGPYQMSNIQIPRNIIDVNSGVFPSSHLCVLSVMLSAYSNTNPNVSNYGTNQTFASSNYLDGSDDSQNLVHWLHEGNKNCDQINNLFPENPIEIVNENFAQMIVNANDNGIQNPCDDDPSINVPGLTDLLCQSFIENDVSDVFFNSSINYNYCHAPYDEIVYYGNIPQYAFDQSRVTTVQGLHTEAALYCFLDYALYFISSDFENYDTVTTLNCQTPTNPTEKTNAPTKKTSAPTKKTSAPTRRLVHLQRRQVHLQRRQVHLQRRR